MILSTFLAGRYIELLVYPLSYKEFIKVYPDSTFKDYVVFGGMPHIIPFNLNYKTIMKALNDTYRSAIFQDVIPRYNIRNKTILEKLLSYIFANPSKTFSALAISNYFKSEKINVSVDTVINYLKYCEDAYLIKRVSRKELPSKEILKTEEKFFIMDHSYREAIIGSNESSIELILENIVYIELLRRGYEVYVGKVKNYEIDFVCFGHGRVKYVQVTLSIPKGSKRESDNLLLIKDNYEKVIVTYDYKDVGTVDGIEVIHLTDFLIEKSY